MAEFNNGDAHVKYAKCFNWQDVSAAARHAGIDPDKRQEGRLKALKKPLKRLLKDV